LAGFVLHGDVESVMFVFMFILVFVAATGMGAVIVAPQIVADRTTRSPAKACANGRAG
jgi:hypothetical protein